MIELDLGKTNRKILAHEIGGSQNIYISRGTRAEKERMGQREAKEANRKISK